MSGAPHTRPGANALRGGQKSFGAKTLGGNWYESRKDPAFPGCRREAATEAAERALEGTRRTVPLYGTGLPTTAEATFEDGHLDYSNVVGFDKTAGPGEWKSVTAATYVTPGEEGCKDFSTSFKTLSHTSTEDLDAYKARWLVAGDKAAGERFTSTASASATGVPSTFRVRPTRVLPGVPKVVETFREKIIERGGMLGIRTIGRMFRIMDDSGDHKLSRSELTTGLHDYGLRFTPDEFEALWRFLDRDRSGTIDYDEFLRGVRGEMNDRRVGMVELAWEVLDKTKDGKVTIDDLRGTYDPSFHPEVVKGTMTPDEALAQFLAQWDTKKADGVVEWDEFLEYYDSVSCSIDDDDYFELMMRNAWHLPGGTGWCENTANLRVLVTHADGSKTIEMVKDDLGLKRSDLEAIKRRLVKQGITDVVAVSTSF